MNIEPDPFDDDRDSETAELNSALSALQQLSRNNGGYFHFRALKPVPGGTLEEQAMNILHALPRYRTPYLFGEEGDRRYIKAWDLKNATFRTVEDPEAWIIEQATHWAEYSGTHPEHEHTLPEYHSLKTEVARKIITFLIARSIVEAKEVEGIDTFYSFGLDHMGADLLVDTLDGMFVVHFGFSS